jgi:hypothetical protein
MTGPSQRTNDPLALLALRIGEIERVMREANSKSIRIPVLAADPSEADPTNIWLFPDGRLRMRHLNTLGTAYVYREFVATAPGSSSSATAPASPATTAKVNTALYPAVWSQSYRGDAQPRTDDGTVMLYFGQSPGDTFNGLNASLIGFDYTTIASNLTGSTINSVKLRLQNLASYNPDGVQIYFGIHNYTAEPATWSGTGIPAERIVNHHFGKVEEKDVELPIAFAQAIRDGWGKGVAIQAPNSNREFYGKAAGFGSGLTLPTLIINYTK